MFLDIRYFLHYMFCPRKFLHVENKNPRLKGRCRTFLYHFEKYLKQV